MNKTDKKVSRKEFKVDMSEPAREGKSDVLGSYTGVPLIDDEYPVQDADDL